MMPINEIDLEELQVIAEKLNDTVLTEEINTDTDDVDALLADFMDAVSKVPVEREEELPEEVVEFYNRMVEDMHGGETEAEQQEAQKEEEEEQPSEGEIETEEEAEGDETEAAKKKKKSKKKTPKTETKKKKKTAPPTRALNVFGHVVGTKAAMIDEELVRGGTLKEISQKVGVKPYRVKHHAAHLETDKQVKVVVEGEVYKIA